MLGLYVHIPFCAQKCYYCDFNSQKIESNTQKQEYLINLEKEMQMYKEEFKNKEFTSIFIGGGTPSILTSKEIQQLMKNIYKNFNIKEYAEITIESNPGTLNIEKLKTIKEMGINRLSMGLQTTQDDHLKYIGRIHTYEQFEKNYKDAVSLGFKNINVDLMYSLPNQSFEDFKESLDKIISLNPSHISAYSLILEEGTKFNEMYENKEFELPEEEIDIQIYEYTINKLRENGYNQYEISNYAQKNHECKHNIVYWKCKNYLGLGCGASGYISDMRYSNTETINEYNELINQNKKPIENKEILTLEDSIEEFIIMGLRMNEGISLQDFYNRFKVDFKQKYKTVLENMKKQSLLEEKEDRIYFTQKGREISNTVLIEFMK